MKKDLILTFWLASGIQILDPMIRSWGANQLVMRKLCSVHLTALDPEVS